jgi:hypothetical protein
MEPAPPVGGLSGAIGAGPHSSTLHVSFANGSPGHSEHGVTTRSRRAMPYPSQTVRLGPLRAESSPRRGQRRVSPSASHGLPSATCCTPSHERRRTS